MVVGMGKKQEEEETFYCPLRSNHQVDDSGGEKPCWRVDRLDRSEEDLEKGELIRSRGSPRTTR